MITLNDSELNRRKQQTRESQHLFNMIEMLFYVFIYV